MEKHPFDKYRKEVKFLAPLSDFANVENQLHKLKFIEQYKPRLVHSIYFDTQLDDFLADSIDGLSERQKIRIRYYNQGEDIRLEKKIKSDQFGKKEIIPLDISDEKLLEVGAMEKIVLNHTHLVTRMTARVCYWRKYYYSNEGNVRITLDSALQTEELIFGRKRNLQNQFLIEIKCGSKQSINLNLNLMPQRFSKYSFARFAD